MVSFLDFLMPQNTGLNPDQLNYADTSGLMNAGMQLADMSAPHYGPRATVMQLISHGLNAYQQGAQNSADQFYKNQETQAGGAAAAVQTAVDKQNLDWFNNNKNSAANAASAAPASVAPTLQSFYAKPAQLKTPQGIQYAQMMQESGGDPNAVSPKGASGIAQIMPATARDPGYGVKPLQNWDGVNPASAPIDEQLRFMNDYRNAMPFDTMEGKLAAYNAGPGKMQQVAAGTAQMPAETAAYVPAVMARAGQQSPVITKQNPLAAYYAQNNAAPQATPDAPQSAPQAAQAAGAPNIGVGNPELANHLYDLAERQLRSNRPGGAELMQLAQSMGKEPGFAQWQQMTPQQQQQYSQYKMAGQMSPFMGMTAGAAGGAADGATDSAGLPTGDAFLKQLSPPIATQIKALAEGRQQFPGGMAMKQPYWMQMLQLVAQYDPSFDQINFGARSGLLKDYTSGKTRQNINSIETALNTMAQVKSASDKLGDGVTGAGFLNSPLNKAKAAIMGAEDDPNLSTYNVLAKTGADEVTKAVTALGGTGGDRDTRYNALTAGQSGPARTAAIRANITELMQRLDPIANAFSTGMNTQRSSVQLLSPQAQKAYQALMDEAAPNAEAPKTGAGNAPAQGTQKVQNWVIKNGKLVPAQ